jgi:hypothetical protein
MSIVELKMFQWQCDRCRRIVVNQIGTSSTKPDGWTWYEVYGCGMTGYTDHRVQCEACALEHPQK